jgi:hypothetical protein
VGEHKKKGLLKLTGFTSLVNHFYIVILNHFNKISVSVQFKENYI